MTVVTPWLLRDWPLPPLDEAADKHRRGTLLVVGGSAGNPGAVLLAGLAGLRAGAGRLQLATAAASCAALAVAVPEALVLPLPGSDVVAAAGGCAALVVGPGLGHQDAAELTLLLAELPPVPLVVDAGALAALTPAVAARHRGRLVITPNEDELARLQPDADPAEVAASLGAVVALRGRVCAPDGREWRVEAGGPGLGTSGSGDVLAGVVGGLLARGAAPEQAAVLGQYLHATAGDRLASRIGRVGYLARELIDEIPVVLRSVAE